MLQLHTVTLIRFDTIDRIRNVTSVMYVHMFLCSYIHSRKRQKAPTNIRKKMLLTKRRR